MLTPEEQQVIKAALEQADKVQQQQAQAAAEVAEGAAAQANGAS